MKIAIISDVHGNLEALKAVKSKYDPEGIFHFEQAIKP